MDRLTKYTDDQLISQALDLQTVLLTNTDPMSNTANIAPDMIDDLVRELDSRYMEPIGIDPTDGELVFANFNWL